MAIRKKEMNIPYKAPDMISPEIMAAMEAGVEIKRSKVLLMVSHGAMTGVDPEETKKSDIPSIPGKRSIGCIFLPNAKAQNKQTGKNMPKINDGGLG